MEYPKKSLRQMTQAAMFAALTAVFSQISIPMPAGVPVTLQTFAAALCGYMLGKKWGSASIIVYILLGAVGVPVFAHFKGGFAALTGITGGFIWGFLPMAFLCGLGGDYTREHEKKAIPILLGTAGLLITHLCGVIQFSAIKGGGFISGAMAVSLPFLPKDILSVILAYGLSVILRKRLGHDK